MSLFRSLGRAIARVWNAPEVKEVRRDAEVAARTAVQREINEIILRNMGGPITAGIVRALIGIDKLADSDPIKAAVELAELRAQLEQRDIPHG